MRVCPEKQSVYFKKLAGNVASGLKSVKSSGIIQIDFDNECKKIDKNLKKIRFEPVFVT